MNKFIYLFKDADQKTRINAYITYGCLLAAILILVISSISVVNGPITNFPMLQLVATESELEEFDEEFTELAEELEEAMEDEDEDVLEDFEDEFDISPKKFVKIFSKPLSLSSMKTILEMEKQRDAVLAINMVITIITVGVIIFTVLLLLGGFFMNKALVILTIVLSIGYFLSLVGLVWFILFLALCVAYVVMISSVKESYKNRGASSYEEE